VIKIRAFILIAFFAFSFEGVAQKFSSYEVKAVYLYHFAKYVNWSEERSLKEKFIIGLYGGDPFQGKLPLILKGKTFKDKPWEIINLENKDQLKQVDMLFVSNTKKFELIHLIEEIGDNEILTVGDNIKGFCEIGGHINFTPPEDRHRMEVNRQAVEKAGIKISSRLLAIARIITYEKIKF
jgi:hypothetical protein